MFLNLLAGNHYFKSEAAHPESLFLKPWSEAYAWSEDSPSTPMLVKMPKEGQLWFPTWMVNQGSFLKVKMMEKKPDPPEWVKFLKQVISESEVNENQPKKDKLDQIQG